MNWIRLAPVTSESIFICIALFSSCVFEAATERQTFREIQRNWGAIYTLQQSVVLDGVRQLGDSDLNGPFDVWSGEWWRIPITPLHHATTAHLALCLVGLWVLGSRLEQYWGSLAMIAFLIPAFSLPVMAELGLGHSTIGLSGALCCMLGTLVVLRHYSSEIAGSFPKEAAIVGVLLMFAGWITTITDFFPCPNVAHLTGFCYGALVAWIVSGPLQKVTLLRASFVIAHIWLIPAIILVTHPSWIGRYQWYQATITPNPELAENYLEKAVKSDPALSGAWLNWSKSAEKQGDLSEAWLRLIRGLAENPANAPLIDSTRRLWRHLDFQQRKEAEHLVKQVFGEQSKVWMEQIRATASSSFGDSMEDSTRSDAASDVSQFSLNQKIEIPPFIPRDDAAVKRNKPFPENFKDAVEGELF